MSARTDECQGPQSCFPIRSGISLVEGKEEVTEEMGEFIRLGILGTG